MYKINEKEAEILRGMKNEYYSIKLNITPQYLSGIFNGAKCSGLLAKGIISVYFNISLNDPRMDELIEKYFTKIQED